MADNSETVTRGFEHDGCPYVAVLINDDGYWFCNKCGQVGHETDAERRSEAVHADVGGLDDSMIGTVVVTCRGCKQERWYGYGPCSKCGAYLPGAMCDFGGPTDG